MRNTFGGRIGFFVSGGAPLAKEIAEFFHACGILVLEGYGLTETTAATHVNRADAYRFGSVGKALPGVEVKIAGDGEVLVRGPNILREYFGKPEATREAIDPNPKAAGSTPATSASSRTAFSASPTGKRTSSSPRAGRTSRRRTSRARSRRGAPTSRRSWSTATSGRTWSRSSP